MGKQASGRMKNLPTIMTCTPKRSPLYALRYFRHFELAEKSIQNTVAKRPQQCLAPRFIWGFLSLFTPRDLLRAFCLPLPLAAGVLWLGIACPYSKHHRNATLQSQQILKRSENPPSAESLINTCPEPLALSEACDERLTLSKACTEPCRSIEGLVQFIRRSAKLCRE